MFKKVAFVAVVKPKSVVRNVEEKISFRTLSERNALVSFSVWPS